HVGHLAAAKGPEAPPVERHVLRRIRPHRRGPEPLIPVEARRYRRWIWPLAISVEPSADPAVDLAHRPAHTLADHLDHAAIVVPGVDLCAHLGDELLFSREFREFACLPDSVRQRLLAVRV